MMPSAGITLMLLYITPRDAEQPCEAHGHAEEPRLPNCPRDIRGAVRELEN